MPDIKNKTVVITGGAGLIGSAFSRACAECGANVVVVDIDEKRGNDLVEEIKRETKNVNIIRPAILRIGHPFLSKPLKAILIIGYTIQPRIVIAIYQTETDMS